MVPNIFPHTLKNPRRRIRYHPQQNRCLVRPFSWCKHKRNQDLISRYLDFAGVPFHKAVHLLKRFSQIHPRSVVMQ